MKIGILRETKSPADNRVPLIPKQCRLIEDEFPGTEIIVQPGEGRCFTDQEYRNEGIMVRDEVEDCDVLMGVKEANPSDLIGDKTCFFFSHTIKKQEHNRHLLKAVLDKHIRLVDYELLTDSNGIRIIGFGRWAGLVGTYIGIRAMGFKQNAFELPHPMECSGLNEMLLHASHAQLPPWRIAMTGDGRVAGGAEEMMSAFHIHKVTLENYMIQADSGFPVYIQLDPEKYNSRKSGESFDLWHFFSSPGLYKSNFHRFCNKTDLLINAAYWDPAAPVLFTPGQMKDEDFKIKVIADITCDLNGSVPTTLRTTTFRDPYYDYNRWTGREEMAFSNSSNITVMAIDNLPCGLPKEASMDFGHNLIKNVLPLLLYEDAEGIIARATIAQGGKLTAKYNYLADWVLKPD